MKTILLTALLAFPALSKAELPSEIQNLAGRLGTFTSIYNGKNIEKETGTDCKIEESRYGSGSVVIDSVTYFTPTAHLEGAKRTEKNGVITYVTASNGKRAGGSICGDFIPLTSYKQSVIVTKNSLTLKQNYSCAFFERHEIIESCTVKN